MFEYTVNVLDELKKRGFTTTFIRKHHIFAEKQLTRIRRGEVLGINDLGKLCNILECQLSDIVRHVPDDSDGIPRPNDSGE